MSRPCDVSPDWTAKSTEVSSDPRYWYLLCFWKLIFCCRGSCCSSFPGVVLMGAGLIIDFCSCTYRNTCLQFFKKCYLKLILIALYKTAGTESPTHFDHVWPGDSLCCFESSPSAVPPKQATSVSCFKSHLLAFSKHIKHLCLQYSFSMLSVSKWAIKIKPIITHILFLFYILRH